MTCDFFAALDLLPPQNVNFPLWGRPSMTSQSYRREEVNDSMITDRSKSLMAIKRDDNGEG
jgi:hypothetical protein